MGIGVGMAGPGMKLLERDELLTSLQVLLRNAAAGQGSLLFLEGEAGIGKTSLLRAFANAQQAPVYWGACDPLHTPRPLGPLFDIAAQMKGELQAALDGDVERLRVFSSFLAEISRPPALIVLEDLHWADEPTLDFLRYVGRRIGRTHSLLVVSFRSDEVGPRAGRGRKRLDRRMSRNWGAVRSQRRVHVSSRAGA